MGEPAVKKLYVVTIEVEGLVLADNESEAISFAEAIARDSDLRSSAFVHEFDGRMPQDWDMECCVYSKDREYMTVREAINTLSTEQSFADLRAAGGIKDAP